MLLSLRSGFGLLRVPQRVAAAIMILLVSVSVTSSFVFFRQIALRGLDQPYVEGTNDLVRRGEIVRAVRDRLMTNHPVLPPRTLLLFKGVELWALNQVSAPRLWYRDPSIRLYDVKDLFEEAGHWFVRDPAERRLNGRSGGRVALGGQPVFLFELTDQGLVERPVRSELDGIAIAQIYGTYFDRAPDREMLQRLIAQSNAGWSLGAISDAFA